MIKNYFRIAYRSLLRNKAFSIINISGLALGLSCCLLLALYLQHELSYDRFHGKAHRIVRVIMEYKIGDEGNKGNFTSTRVFPEFKRQFPEVSDGVRMSGTTRLVKYGDKVFEEKDFLFVDSTFFNVFDFKLVGGDKNLVLKAPNMVVLSQSMAAKYFGEDDPVGKSLLISSRQDPFLVTGVVEDCPGNSQIQYSMIASLSSFGPLPEDTYSNANFTTYLLMNSAAALGPLQKKINQFMIGESAREEWTVNFELEPFTKVHLYSPYDAFKPNSNISYIYIIAAVAILILIIACFTYVNLSTARSADRAKEVGVRKSSGAMRKQLFWQFISESFFIAFLALVVSYFLLIPALPAFNSLATTTLNYNEFFQPYIILTALGFIMIVALLAGSYPAFILSSFNPVKVLKGQFKQTNPGNGLRKGLIVFQFVISVTLIICTFIIGEQLKFIQQKKLGYNRDNVIIASLDQKLIEKIELVKKEIKSLPDVKAVSMAYESPVQINGGYNFSGSDLSKEMAVIANPVDEDYFEATGVEFIAGSTFTAAEVKEASQQDYAKNYYHFVLNESAAKALGWKPQEALGKKMYLGENRPGEVKGVVKDFHFASMHTQIEPLVLFPTSWGNNLIVKTDGQNIAGVLTAMEKKWKELAPYRPFVYHFMDEDYQRLYDSEKRMGKVFNVFAALAVMLACMGLFGLSAYAARQRIKEIGVRKVLGASVWQISTLLSSSFVKLVLLAIVISVPIAWFTMGKWLQQFSYRIDMEWWIFLSAGVLSILIAVLTISFQFIKAAMANPVKSLRTE